MLIATKPIIGNRMWEFRSVQGEEIPVLESIRKTLTDYHRKDEVLISVAECCINAIEHGNATEEHRKITVVLRKYEDEYVIRVLDCGRGFACRSVKREIGSVLCEPDPRGWGVYLMHEFTDEVRTGVNEEGRFYVEMVYKREHPA